MWNWFRRWRHRRQVEIYRFFDGQRDRRVDPLRAYREVLAHVDYRHSDWEQLQAKDRVRSLRALNRLATVFRDVFDVASTENGGLSESECLERLREFIGEGEIQKKNIDRLRIWPSTLAWLRYPQLTVNMSDAGECGSISADCKQLPVNPFVQVLIWPSAATPITPSGR